MKSILFAILIFSPFLGLALQNYDPGMPGEDPDLPIDGGLTLLLIAGAAYGLKKVNQQGKFRP